MEEIKTDSSILLETQAGLHTNFPKKTYNNNINNIAIINLKSLKELS